MAVAQQAASEAAVDRILTKNGIVTMTEFYRGWKRKAGNMTLVLACAFAILAVLSFLGPIGVDLAERRPRDRYYLSLASGKITLVSFEPEGSDPYVERYDPWELHFFGFSAEQHYGKGTVINTRSIPIWIALVPLTALSVWLLRKNPTSSKSATEQAA